MTIHLALFHCTRLATRLTRDACARLHRADKARTHKQGCGDCQIGARHARGSEPPVAEATIERVTVPPLPRVCVACGAVIKGKRRWWCSQACSNEAKGAIALGGWRPWDSQA